MARFRGNRTAFGAPGEQPRWSHADKDGIGTAFGTGGPVWFTIWHGILTEVYYPRVDCPQMRDLEFLFSDGDGLFLEEKRDLDYTIERMAPSQGYRVISRDPRGRFWLNKEIISESLRPCVLLHTVIHGDDETLKALKAHVLCAPHLDLGGEGNNAFVVEVSGRELLVSEKNKRWLAVYASCNFSRLSCGYVGQSDGYTDISKHRKMEFEFDEAKNGNVALTGELDLSKGREFTVGVAFGETLAGAVSVVFQSLGIPYKEVRRVFMDQWNTAANGRRPLEKTSSDRGHLFNASYNLLLAHEDKLYQGEFIASGTLRTGCRP